MKKIKYLLFIFLLFFFQEVKSFYYIKELYYTKNISGLVKKYPDVNYNKKLIYIDTRDDKYYKNLKNMSYKLAVSLGEKIESSGAIFILDHNNINESKKVLNSMLPGHKFSYNDGPFLFGYINSQKKEKILIDLGGMSERCLSSYFQDIEQAIVRDTISDSATRKRWKVNSLVCESSQISSNEYRFSIETIWKFVRALKNN